MDVETNIPYRLDKIQLSIVLLHAVPKCGKRDDDHLIRAHILSLIIHLTTNHEWTDIDNLWLCRNTPWMTPRECSDAIEYLWAHDWLKIQFENKIRYIAKGPKLLEIEDKLFDQKAVDEILGRS